MGSEAQCRECTESGKVGEQETGPTRNQTNEKPDQREAGEATGSAGTIQGGGSLSPIVTLQRIALDGSARLE